MLRARSFSWNAVVLAALFALSLAACSSRALPPTGTTGSENPNPGGGAGATATDGGGSAGAEDAASSSSCAFASSLQSFSLPTVTNAATPAFPALSGQTACLVGTSKVNYTLADMNADGEPDLIVTSACDDATVGVSTWLVYLNEGSGFAASPIRFALPTPSSMAGCASTSIFDINGDGLPDYVVTSLCSDATVGTSRWLVYSNVRTGFAATSAPYTLPPGFSAGAFATTSVSTPSCSSGQDVPAFSVFDIDGDAVADFVIMQSCTDATVGTTQWIEYAGSAAGAAQTSTSFSLPTTPFVTAGAFDGLAGTLSCSATVSKPQYGLLDFDADGKVDLVVTEDCDAASDTSVGTTSWLFYRNGGQGFAATPATIALPDLPLAPSDSFTTLSGTGDCATNGAPSYVLVDVNEDGRLDFLVWSDCHDDLTGVSYWKVYINEAASFAASYKALSLPAALGARSGAPAGLAGALSCATPELPAFTTTYLASLSFDVVVTGVCTDTTVGNSRWLLYPASCK